MTRQPPSTRLARPWGLRAPHITRSGWSANRWAAVSSGISDDPIPTVSMPIISTQPIDPSASLMASMASMVGRGWASAPPNTAGTAIR